MQFIIAMMFTLLTASALAQQPIPQGADPVFLAQALSALQAQRNRALDEAASAEAQLAQAQKTIADLQKQIADKPKEEPKP
jgi:chromosome segregation ATPase